MQTAEILGNGQRALDAAVGVGLYLRDLIFLRREAGVGHAAPDRSFPHKTHRRAGREALTFEYSARADGTLRRRERQSRARRRGFSLRDRLRLIGFRIYGVANRTGCGAKRELRPRQRRNRRLLIIQIPETLPAGVQLDEVI